MVPIDPKTLPLCVDMDGTLVKTDMLLESILYLLKSAPLYLLSCFYTLVRRGLPAFKIRIFARARVDLKVLPYHQPLLAYLRAEQARGRKLILATASSQSIAERVAAHVGIFDQVIGSGAERNLSGTAKGEHLAAVFGPKGFVYAGNTWIDLKVWKHAGGAVVVHAPPGLAAAAAKLGPVEAEFPHPKPFVKAVLKATRAHQWVKNFLIFAPLFLAHKLLDVQAVRDSVIGLLAFTAMSASVYLLNDLLDLDSDRRHPDNQRRPFASGDLALGWGLALQPLLFLSGVAIGAFLSSEFLVMLFGYYLLTLAYSLRLKQVELADVLILASLYTWRIFAGSVAINVPVSAWFLTFSGFFFLSLALNKRCAELIMLAKHAKAPNARRGYSAEDLSQLVSFGSAAGYISVLVLALYINHDQVTQQYQRPMVLWLACPFVLYWLSRMWLKAHRGKMSSDPLVFAQRDPASYVVVVAMAVLWLLASGVV